MPLGITLKALRHQRKLNQKALSMLSGVSQATISRIETGQVQQLRSSALKHLAHALGVSTDFLIADSDPAGARTAETPPTIGTMPDFPESRFRRIADALDPFIVHEQGSTLYVNQTFADAVGYRQEELLGKNGLELITVPQSRPACLRLLNAVSTGPVRLLLVRKDGSVFPAELSSSDLTETTRLAIMRDVSRHRREQAAARVLQAGLVADHLLDMERVIRVLADEVEDMGLAFEVVGVNIIDEERDEFHSFMACPESHLHRSFQGFGALQETLGRSSALRGLVSHWRRRIIWEREADEDFAGLIGAAGRHLSSLLVDVPLEYGTLTLGLPLMRFIRMEDVVSLLTQVSQPMSCLLKRLLLMGSLQARLRALQARDSATHHTEP